MHPAVAMPADRCRNGAHAGLSVRPTSQNTATRDLAVESLVKQLLLSNWNAVHPHLLIATPLAMATTCQALKATNRYYSNVISTTVKANAVTRLTVFLRHGGGHDHFGRPLAVNVIGIQAAEEIRFSNLTRLRLSRGVGPSVGPSLSRTRTWLSLL